MIVLLVEKETYMFYYVNQNNSGGRYITSVSAGVDENIIIEADNGVEAQAKFDAIRKAYGAGFDDFCECCGERWWASFYADDAKDKPSVWDDEVIPYPIATTVVERMMDDYITIDCLDTYIHYKDGSVMGANTKGILRVF